MNEDRTQQELNRIAKEIAKEFFLGAARETGKRLVDIAFDRVQKYVRVNNQGPQLSYYATLGIDANGQRYIRNALINQDWQTFPQGMNLGIWTPSITPLGNFYRAPDGSFFFRDLNDTWHNFSSHIGVQNSRFGQGIRHRVEAKQHPQDSRLMIVSISNCFPGEQVEIHFQCKITKRVFDSVVSLADNNGYLNIVSSVNWMSTPTSIVTYSPYDGEQTLTHLND